MPRADASSTPVAARLASEILTVLETQEAGAPAVVARNADSAVIAALLDNRKAFQAKRVRPQVLLTSHASPATLAALAVDFDVRVAASDMHAMLREQVIFGGLSWFGDALARGSARIGGEGRFFKALPRADWRGLRLVFDGLWAVSATVNGQVPVRASGHVFSGEFAGAGA